MGRPLLLHSEKLDSTYPGSERGSHHFLRHADGRGTVVPVHGGETIGPGLLTKIINDCDMTREEFEQLL